MKGERKGVLCGRNTIVELIILLFNELLCTLVYDRRNVSVFQNKKKKRKKETLYFLNNIPFPLTSLEKYFITHEINIDKTRINSTIARLPPNKTISLHTLFIRSKESTEPIDHYLKLYRESTPLSPFLFNSENNDSKQQRQQYYSYRNHTRGNQKVKSRKVEKIF